MVPGEMAPGEMWTRRYDTRSDVDQEIWYQEGCGPGEMTPGVMWTRRDGTRRDGTRRDVDQEI